MLFTPNRAAADAADKNSQVPVRTANGVRRNQGPISAPTRAMLAAACVPYTIPYKGAAQQQLTHLVAPAFISASLAGARVRNLPSPGVSIAEVVAAIREVEVASAIESSDEISFSSEADGSPFAALASDFAATPLLDGARETLEGFQDMLARGLVAARG